MFVNITSGKITQVQSHPTVLHPGKIKYTEQFFSSTRPNAWPNSYSLNE